MPKSRIMGAGLAGASVQGANVNQVTFGNKLQGLTPTSNKEAGSNLNTVKSRTKANKKDVVFCMNQLAGGVGKTSRSFSSSSDGVKNCKQDEYLKNLSSNSEELTNVQSLENTMNDEDEEWEWFCDPYCDQSGNKADIHNYLDISGSKITFSKKGPRAVSRPLQVIDSSRATCILLKWTFEKINDWNNCNFYATIRSDLEDSSGDYIVNDISYNNNKFLYFPNGYYDAQPTYAETEHYSGNLKTQVRDEFIDNNVTFGQFALGTKDYSAMTVVNTKLNESKDGFSDSSYNAAYTQKWGAANDYRNSSDYDSKNEYQALPPIQPYSYNPAHYGNPVDLNYVCPEIDFVETCGKLCASTAVHIEVSKLLDPDVTYTNNAYNIWKNVLEDSALNTYIYGDASLNLSISAENPAFYDNPTMNYNDNDQDPNKVIMGYGVDRSCKLISGLTVSGKEYLDNNSIGWYDGNMNSYYDGILYQKDDANCYQKLNTEANIDEVENNAIEIETKIMNKEPVYQLITFSEEGLKISWIADEGIANKLYSEHCENNSLISKENNVLEPSTEDASGVLVPFMGAWQSASESSGTILDKINNNLQITSVYQGNIYTNDEPTWPEAGSSPDCSNNFPFQYYNTPWAGGWASCGDYPADCSGVVGGFWQKFKNMNDDAGGKNIYELTGERLNEAKVSSGQYIVLYSSVWNVISDGAKQAGPFEDKYGDWYAGMYNGLKCEKIIKDFVNYNKEEATKEEIDKRDEDNVTVSLEVVSYCNLKKAI